MASLLYGKFQLFHRNFSLMEKLQNETAMYTRLVYIDTVGHGLKKLRACLICQKRPNGHPVVTNDNEQSFLK
jgi:hypothetical protein